MPRKKTKEQIAAELKKYQFINQMLQDKYQESINTENDFLVFEVAPKNYSDKELLSFINNTNPKTKKLVESAQNYAVKFAELKKYANEEPNTLFDTSGTDLGRLAPYMIDYSYVTLPSSSPEYGKCISKNASSIGMMKTTAGLQRLVEGKIRTILQLDLKKLSTGTLQERFDYVKENADAVNLLVIADDLHQYYRDFTVRNPNTKIDQDLLNAFAEKRAALQQFGGVETLVRGYGSGLCNFMLDPASKTFPMCFSNYKTENVDPNDMEKQYEIEMCGVAGNISIGNISENTFNKEKASYELLAKNGIIGEGNQNLRYEAVNEKNETIALSDAINLLNENKTVKFRERSVEQIQHILQGSPAPENKYTGRTLEVCGLDRYIDSIKEATGVSSLTEALNNGYIAGGEVYGEKSLIEPIGDDRAIMQSLLDRVKGGEKLIMSHQGYNGVIVEGELKFVNGKAVAKDMVPEKRYNDIKQIIEYTRDKINGTGKGYSDSEEFNKFKESLNKPIPRDKESLDKLVNEIKNGAGEYVFAKLDQSQNSRRRTRFNEAAKIMEMLEAVEEDRMPSMDNVNKNIIAAKSYKAMMNAELKGPHADEAEAILGDKDVFFKKVEKLKNKPEFKEYLEKQSAKKSLEKVAGGSAKDLSKDVSKNMGQAEPGAIMNM